MIPSLYVDESPHVDSRLEWWFVHGRFSGPSVDERYFMVSLFRFEIPNPSGNPVTTFSALLSTLDPATLTHSTSSRVDHRVLHAIRHHQDARSIDPFAVPVVLDEIRQYGLPRDFTSPDSEPVLLSQPLFFEWDDLVLASHPEGISLSFNDPATALPIALHLTVATPRLPIDEAATVGEPDEAMAYVTYPHLSLTGSLGGLSVAGDAWFDHQWGGDAWMRSPGPQPCPRGWDWLGFRLSDGSAGVVMSHWDAASGVEFAHHITLRDPSGNVHVSRSFEWVPSRSWTSPSTRVTHPVSWTLHVPEWNAELAFEPLADHQEIRVLGSLRSVWEGAGRVTGHIRGVPVEGSARLEGQGRGYLFDVAGYLHAWAGLVDRELARFLPHVIAEQDVCRWAGPPAWTYEPSSFTAMLSTPLWDLMGRDGKRWRAVFSFLLLDTLGRDPEPILDVGMVLPELLHNASLIIDDIQDDSPLRRGYPAIHRRYGVDVAISAANTAYFLPLLVVLDHPTLTRDEKMALSESYQRQLVRAHLGQSLDLFWTHSLSPVQLDLWMADSIGPKILQTYAFKTAAPVVGVAEAAATLAGACPALRDAVLHFARSFGIAFQLIDDVKNFSSAPGWGKQRGEDLKSGKLTYLILRALEKLPPSRRASLSEILCHPGLREDPATLARGIDLVTQSGAFESVRDEARALVAPAWDALSRLVPPSCSKTELRLLWEALVECDGEPGPPLES